MNKSYKILSTATFLFTLNSAHASQVASAQCKEFSHSELEQIELLYNNPQKIYSPFLKETHVVLVKDESDPYLVIIRPKNVRIKATLKSVSKHLPKVFGPEEL